ncbi:tetratricopeptide repeat protein [Flavobacterium difficile]|uniref:Tetratricopeptide repeat protein n=1 Tax=Flavobacterium difficile TaxID=2709659 RepID=A0ABX0I1Y6_9FLAO|nr:tetratricopeptide repeat protein [Flavobacterium difficile]NHM00731.1 tetratricopeptide repeat protein [Flavobacterium difficile]
MRKITYLFVMLFACQITIAKDKDLLLSEARQYALNKEYSEAIKSYNEVVKTATDAEMKEIYFEMANCYYKNNETKKAVKTLKKSIKKFGLTEEDIIYSKVLDADLSSITIAELYNDFTRLRNKYITYQEKN